MKTVIHPALRDPPPYRDSVLITLALSAGALIATAYISRSLPWG